MADHLWLIGSPETVAAKLRRLYGDVGGFGALLMLVYDHWQDQEGWDKSTHLLAEKVMPMVADLTGEAA
ncbi:2,5-diketocamphane 1,2-monooxygenase 1 [Geodia barretti]|uniref:2,5-diketocamphane 1,2-monooxygenase 1 n=1 Tax=Geodia barretti TaxID=519541 RepID=A0AA35XMU0_GEOBA|nr:2,5-diketocamphane 1,2-monooxygenase 1 [Geodia barretti]